MRQIKTLIIIVMLLVMTGVKGMAERKPTFIPERKVIRKNILDRIFVTEDEYRGHKIPDKIYFANKKGKLVNTINIFPANVKKRVNVKIFNSPSGKYIAVDTVYTIPAEKTEKGTFEFEGKFVKVKDLFRIVDEQGNILWETDGNQYREVFLTDEGKVIFGYLHEGYLDINTVNGEYISKKKISDWVEERVSEEEPEITYRTIFLKSGNIVVTRTTNLGFEKEKHKNELLWINNEGNTEWKKEKVGFARFLSYISPNEKYIIIGKTIKIDDNNWEKYIEVFNRKGEKLWEIARPSGYKIESIDNEYLIFFLIESITKSEEKIVYELENGKRK